MNNFEPCSLGQSTKCISCDMAMNHLHEVTMGSEDCMKDGEVGQWQCEVPFAHKYHVNNTQITRKFKLTLNFLY